MSSSCDISFVFIMVYVMMFLCEGISCMRDYRGYSVLKAIPSTEQQLYYLQSLEELVQSPPFDIDIWRLSAELNDSSYIMLNTKASSSILQELDELSLDYSYTIPDVEQVIRKQKISNEHIIGRRGNDKDFFSTYRPIDEIYSYLNVLQSISPENIDIVTTGKSFEGQDLKVLRINKDETGSKKIVWIDGGTHAREWIGVSTAMYLAASLATARQACDIGDASRCSEDMERMFKKLEFRIQPVVNPDGYMYAHTEDRMWRKTRSTNSPSPWSYFCRGVDPNRNYDVKWGGASTSRNPCSDTFPGLAPHSEPEVKSLTDYVSKDSERTIMFLTLHSFSQLMLLPYGHSTEVPPDYAEIETLANIGANEFRVRGTSYRIGSPARILYAASGTASDWAYSQGIKYSYTIELPDTGERGFLLPEDRIKPVGEETWAALKSMVLTLIQ